MQRFIDAIANNERESRKRWMPWLFKQPEDKATNKTNYQFWQSDNHTEWCFSLPFAWQKLTYIHNNPLRQVLYIKGKNTAKAVRQIIILANKKEK